MLTETDRDRITPATEDYVKAIYMLQQQGVEVTTSLLGEQLGGLKAGSVSGMLKKLADLRLVQYTPYQQVRLTHTGEQVALEIVRHHRLLELYLVQALGYSWDEVHDEAEVLEHYISEKLEARIAAHLGDPGFDPHGDPIPTTAGEVPVQPDTRLADVARGTVVDVVRVCDQHAARLRYLQSLGLVPGSRLEVTAVAPFEGPVSVRIGDAVHPLDHRVARMIWVVPVALPPSMVDEAADQDVHRRPAARDHEVLA
jgi:DtxR family transcriptional regulator, Mn-dependent transcriptional regulator